MTTMRWMAGLAVAFALNGCYLSHVTFGQFQILASTVDLDQALDDPALGDADKAKLQLIQEIKAYAETELHLAKTCNYSTVLPGEKKPLNYVVTAAKKDGLESVTWWFPIVGSIAYKGFFDRAMAQEEADELAEDGNDVFVWPAGAYSTLGWFCDPIIPTMLDLDESRLATLIIHELVHSTLTVSGDTDFNESLANFVAHRGAPQYLDAKYGPGNPHSADLLRRLEGKEAVNDVLQRLAGKLRTLYASRSKHVLMRRAAMFAQAKQEAQAICRETGVTDELCLPGREINNAVVLSRLAYGSPAPFEKIFASVGRDWRRFFRVLRAQHEKDPWYPP